MWHQLCWTTEYKERETNKKAAKDQLSYNTGADVKPEYYRVSEVHDKPESVVSVPSSQPSTPSTNEGAVANFCSQCGKKISW